MPTILVYPGQKSDPVALQDVLREQHEASREAVAKEIAARKAKGVPIDDETKWSVVAADLAKLSTAVASKGTADVEATARAIVGAVAGNAMVELAPYENDAELDGVTVSFVMVSDAQRRDWTARREVKRRAMNDARRALDDVAYFKAINELEDIGAEQIVACVDSIGGVEGVKPTIAESMQGLRLSPLFSPLIYAVRYFLELPAGKALRCGRLLPST